MERKISLIGIAILLLMPNFSFAEESKDEKISTTLVLKNDFVSPRHQEGYFSQTTSVYWHYKWFGGGGDVTYTPRKDYLCIQPYATLNKGPFYILVGYSGDNLGVKHVQTGAWYVNTHGKFFVFFDLRNYWAAGKDSIGYLDFWAFVSHPLGNRFYAGVEAEYIHWWEKNPHNWFLVGPLVGVNLTKNISLYVRPSLEWDVAEKKTDQAFKVRVGIKFTF